jgi:hypothetical protein
MRNSGRGRAVAPAIVPTIAPTIYGVCLLFVVFILSGCSFTQSAFERTADNAGGAFAAAATTLTYLHQGKLSRAYAVSSFVNYESELSGLDQQLPSQQGAPAQSTVQRLIALYQPAMRAVEQPCLDVGCDWRGQVAALERASQAFVEVSGA